MPVIPPRINGTYSRVRDARGAEIEKRYLPNVRARRYISRDRLRCVFSKIDGGRCRTVHLAFFGTLGVDFPRVRLLLPSSLPFSSSFSGGSNRRISGNVYPIATENSRRPGTRVSGVGSARRRLFTVIRFDPCLSAIQIGVGMTVRNRFSN